jgi:hypothetical protein
VETLLSVPSGIVANSTPIGVENRWRTTLLGALSCVDRRSSHLAIILLVCKRLTVFIAGRAADQASLLCDRCVTVAGETYSNARQVATNALECSSMTLNCGDTASLTSVHEHSRAQESSSCVLDQLPKLNTRVRFPSSAPPERNSF